MQAEVVEVQRRPEEENAAHLRGRRRATGVATDERPDPPRTILGADDFRRVEFDPNIAELNPSRPPAELGEPGRVHDLAKTSTEMMTGFLDIAGTPFPQQVAGEVGVVLGHGDPARTHRFDDLEGVRPDGEVARFVAPPSRYVECVLPPLVDERHVGILHAQVLVERRPGAEVEVARGRVAVEPIPLVDVLVARRRVGNGIGGLVDRIVVEPREHDPQCGG